MASSSFVGTTRTAVLVVPTNEELAIARQALDLVGSAARPAP